MRILSSNGWNRKTYEEGNPLVNVMSLHAIGGSSFVKVVSTANMRNDTIWIAEKHVEWARYIGARDDLVRLAGTVMDNTCVNVKGQKALSTEDPHLINLGYQSHALSPS